MFNWLKKFFSPAEVVDNVVVQEVEDGEDAIMKNAMLAIQTGKIVYGDYEDGVLTSHVSQEEND